MPHRSSIGCLLYHLWGDVVGSATQRIPPFGLFDLSGKSKISNFEHQPLCQKQVTQLDIPMHNILGMHLLQPHRQLPNKEPSFLLGEYLPPPDQLVECLVDTQF